MTTIMHKKYWLGFLFLFAVNMYAQQKNVKIHWNDVYYQLEENKTALLPIFQPENFQYLYDKHIIEYADIFPDSQLADANSVQIANIRYESIDINKYNAIDTENIPSALNVKIESTSARGDIKTSIRFTPIIKQGNSYQKVVSMDINYSYQRNLATNNMASASLNTTQSVLANGDWYKFKIDETGIYRLDKNFLTSIGIPENVDPRTIKIYGHGGRMLPLGNDENFHFDLPEVALRSFGETDGTLDEGDYFLFYAEGDRKSTRLNS